MKEHCQGPLFVQVQNVMLRSFPERELPGWNCLPFSFRKEKKMITQRISASMPPSSPIVSGSSLGSTGERCNAKTVLSD